MLCRSDCFNTTETEHLLIELEGLGPFHHLSNELVETNRRKEKSSAPVGLCPHLHCGSTPDNIQDVGQKYTNILDIN